MLFILLFLPKLLEEGTFTSPAVYQARPAPTAEVSLLIDLLGKKFTHRKGLTRLGTFAAYFSRTRSGKQGAAVPRSIAKAKAPHQAAAC
jgi:hypothetical protein